ncbi:TNF receptor-associated factor 3-like [Ornithodoros turicata]|uniref:TNF receptor-associated factor 3-like n=1 Tax=Ornithodoros turicata TaxID=34597 RepID=UPI003139FD3C
MYHVANPPVGSAAGPQYPGRNVDNNQKQDESERVFYILYSKSESDKKWATRDRLSSRWSGKPGRSGVGSQKTTLVRLGNPQRMGSLKSGFQNSTPYRSLAFYWRRVTSLTSLTGSSQRSFCLIGFCETLDWRPVDFVDLSSALCCTLCSVIPGKTFLLQCSHAVCQLCYDGLLKCGGRCPMDKECFEESGVQTFAFSQRRVERQIVLCMNSKKGCAFVGTVEEMKHHFFKECEFHAVTCKLCRAKVLRREVVNHYTQRCQHRRSSPGGDYSRGDGVELEAMPDVSVRKYEQNITSVVRQLNEHQELLKRILEKQERLDTAVSNAGNEFHEQVEEQTRFLGEAVNRTLERSLRDTNRNLQVIKEEIEGNVQQLDVMHEGLNSAIEKQFNEQAGGIRRNEELLKKVLEKQEGVTTDVSNVASQLQDLHEEETKVYNEVLKAKVLLEHSDATLENMESVKRDLNTLLQRSEEGIKFINVEVGEEKEMKPIAKAIFDISQKTESLEEAANSLHLQRLSDSNEVFYHIEGFSEFRMEWEGKRVARFSDVFVFCGYSAKLEVDISKVDGVMYLGLFFCVCRSSRDSLLKWPFTIPYTLMLVHPKDEKNNIELSKTDFSTNTLCFCRPITAQNVGMGIGELCKVEDVERLGFVFQDSLCVGVKVHSGR